MGEPHDIAPPGSQHLSTSQYAPPAGARKGDRAPPAGPLPQPSPVQTPVLNRFAHVFRLKVRRSLEIGEGAGGLENPVVSPRGERGSRDAGEVALDAEGPADAIVPRIAEIAAGTSPRCLFAM